MILDIPNACCEGVVAGLVFRNCWLLYKARHVSGTSVLTPCFYTFWAFAAVRLYFDVGYTFSAVGSAVAGWAHMTWVGLAIYYRRKR